jgi:protein-tyrosine phosphatase
MSVRILMVCTGNTCRSPMAECLLKARLKRLNRMDIEVRSAGLYADAGARASLGARRAMQRRGLSLEAHTARAFDPEWARDALILGMTQGHVQAVRQGYGLNAQTLGQLAGGRGDIADPFGGQDAEYERAARQIEQAIEAIDLESLDWKKTTER